MPACSEPGTAENSGQTSARLRLRDNPWTLEELRAHCKTLLSDYIHPHALVLCEQRPGAPPGKPDYRAARALACAELGITENSG